MLSIASRFERALELEPKFSWFIHIMEDLQIFCLCCALCLIAYLWDKSRTLRDFDRIPGLNTFEAIRLFIFSSYSEIFQSITHHIPKKYGPVVRMTPASFHPHVLITNSRCLEQLMRNNNEVLKSKTYQFFKTYTGQSIFIAEGERWHTLRKVMNPGFRFKALHDFVPVFSKHAVTLTENLAKEAGNLNGFQLLPYFSICALDIVCETTMGFGVNVQNHEKAMQFIVATARMLQLIVERYLKPWLYNDYIFQLFVLLCTKTKVQNFYNLADEVIKERREHFNSLKPINRDDMEQGSKQGTILVDFLLASEKNYPEYLTPADIRYNVAVMLSGGVETVATASTFLLFLLGTYPDIQDKVVEELIDVFEDSGRLPDVADIANLKYLDRCIKEALRLYPSACFIERTNVKDIQIDNHVLPAGCTITVNIYAIQHDPEVYPDPEKFDPDRFLPENCQGRSPYSYIPFSIGARNCIGQKFAILEEKIVLSTFLRRYRVEAMQDRNKLKLEAAVILRESDGIRIRVFEREAHPKLRVHEQ